MQLINLLLLFYKWILDSEYDYHGTNKYESKWYHVALVNNSGTHHHLDVVEQVNENNPWCWMMVDSTFVVQLEDKVHIQSMNGYISNIRVRKGTALYKTSFTPTKD